MEYKMLRKPDWYELRNIFRLFQRFAPSRKMEAQLAQLVEHYLSIHLHDNALFFAERLFTMTKSEVNRHLLASCFLYSGKRAQAVAVLRDSTAPTNRYLLARYCMEDGKLQEAEETLLRPAGLAGRSLSGGVISALRRDCGAIPNGPAGLYLLGCIMRAQQRFHHASAMFQLALHHDPFLWSAYEQLCELGAGAHPASSFAMSPEYLARLTAQLHDAASTSAAQPKPNAFEGATGVAARPSEHEREPLLQGMLASQGRGDRPTRTALSFGPTGERPHGAHDKRPTPIPFSLASQRSLQRGDLSRSEAMALSSFAMEPENDNSTPQQQQQKTNKNNKTKGYLLHRGSRAGPLTPAGLLPLQEESAHAMVPGGRRGNTEHPSPLLSPIAPFRRMQLATPPGMDLSFLTPPAPMQRPSIRSSDEEWTPQSAAGRPSWQTPATAPDWPTAERWQKSMEGRQERTQQQQLLEAARSGPQRQAWDPREPWETPQVSHMEDQEDEEEQQQQGDGMGGTVGPAGLGTGITPEGLPVATRRPPPVGPTNRTTTARRKRNRPGTAEDYPSDAPTNQEPAATTSGGGDVDHPADQWLEGFRNVHGLMQLFGTALRAFHQLDREETLEALRRIPAPHGESGWVLSVQGRMLHESARYKEALAAFGSLRLKFPHYLKGLEVFSTTLWHLKRRSPLSLLVQELMEFDRRAPETWCAAGNLHSLQRSHTKALECFDRAVQVDPGFAYAHTLRGHESLALGDEVGAMRCYREALAAHPRHYNAWYGLGCLYQRMGRFDVALTHIRRAVTLHPNSPILRCHLATVLKALGSVDSAEEELWTAVRQDPGNPQAEFQLAELLAAAGQLSRARSILERVRERAPREPAVLVHLARVYKRQDRLDKAAQLLNAALELGPTDAHTIHAELDHLHHAAEDDADDNDVF